MTKAQNKLRKIINDTCYKSFIRDSLLVYRSHLDQPMDKQKKT